MRFITLILLFLSGFVKAQTLTVYIADHEKNDAVAFASIVNAKGKFIGSADVDGKMVFADSLTGQTFTVKSVGYKTQTFILEKDRQQIFLIAEDNTLNEVEILPGENPAHRIIRTAINNREKNDPNQCCRFTYESYNKLIIFMYTDSMEYKRQTTKDSTVMEIIDFSNKSHFFITESVTEKKHVPPDQDHEKVIAARVSGFSNPAFTLLSTELQSFSFYNDYVSLLGERYISPLCPGSINKYLFLISDTLIEGNDSVYILTFTPRKNKSFKALTGEIHISTRGYAIASVKAEPASATATLKIRIQQLHEQIDGTTWFPVQLNARLLFPSIKIGQFELTGEATGYLRNIKLNANVRNRDIQEVDVELPDNDADHNKLLQEYRVDSLTAQEKYTYHVIDSVSKAVGLEKRMGLFTSLAMGRIPLGPVEIDITRLFDYNNYEGYRVGLGLYTSRKLINWMQIGGYGAYGFKDKEFKYGGDMTFFIYPKKDIRFTGSYQLDLLEAGSPVLFPMQTGALTNDGIRELYLSRFDMAQSIEANFRTRLFKHFSVQVLARTVERQPRYDYTYVTNPVADASIDNTYFSLFETGINLRFKFREKFFLMGKNLISKGSKWPTLTFQYLRSIKGVLNGEWNMYKMRVQLDHAFNIRHLGRLLLQANYVNVSNDAPYFYLVHPASTFTDLFGISAQNTFETMRVYEFTVTEGYAIHVTHQFLSALFHRKQKPGPQLELCASAFYGTYNGINAHRSGFTFTAPKNMYTEAGFRLNRIIKNNFSTMGAGVFYRFGPNAFASWKENIALRLTIGFSAD